MSMPGGGTVSNAVLATKLDAVGERIDTMAAEVRALRSEHVRRDLYEAHRSATEAELRRIAERCEQDAKDLRAALAAERSDRAALRRQMVMAFIVGGFGVVSALVAALAG